jgi:HlyD family secretion protein
MAQIPAQPKSNKKLYIGLGIAGVLVLLALVAASVLGGGPSGTEVDVEAAQRRTLTQVVTASGRVQPETEVRISPEVSGEIVELRVREGDAVEAGEVLVRIRPDVIQAQVEQLQAGLLQSRASLSQAEANLLNAQQEAERQRALAAQNLVAQQALDAAETQVQVAEAQVEGARFSVQSAEARLREAREQLANTTIVAPMSGTVSQLNVELGERVVGTSQMAGTELMRIAQLERMEMEIDVNENDIVNVSLGDSALVEIDAYPDVPMRGVVTEIANSARLGAGQDQVTNFLVKVRVLGVGQPRPAPGVGLAVAQPEVVIPGGDVQLRPGMSGTVDVYTETIRDAIAVPIGAVTARDFDQVSPDTTDAPESGVEDLRKVVFVVEGGRAQMREVTTGIADATHIHIRSGISDTARVVVGPFSALSRSLRPDARVVADENDEG